MESLAQCLGYFIYQFRDLGGRARGGISAGPAVGQRGQNRRPVESEISSAEGGEDSGQGVACAADRLHGLDTGRIHSLHQTTVMDDMVGLPFDQQISGAVVMAVGPADQIGNVVVRLEEEAPGVKGMGAISSARKANSPASGVKKS